MQTILNGRKEIDDNKGLKLPQRQLLVWLFIRSYQAAAEAANPGQPASRWKMLRAEIPWEPRRFAEEWGYLNNVTTQREKDVMTMVSRSKATLLPSGSSTSKRRDESKRPKERGFIETAAETEGTQKKTLMVKLTPAGFKEAALQIDHGKTTTELQDARHAFKVITEHPEAATHPKTIERNERETERYMREEWAPVAEHGMQEIAAFPGLHKEKPQRVRQYLDRQSQKHVTHPAAITHRSLVLPRALQDCAEEALDCYRTTSPTEPTDPNLKTAKARRAAFARAVKAAFLNRVVTSQTLDTDHVTQLQTSGYTITQDPDGTYTVRW